MERIAALGLDVGKRRIGVAGCDGTGLIATGLTVIERTSWQADVERLQKLVQEREAQVLVVGLPYTMDGSLGFQGKQVQKYARRVGKALQLPVEYVDERLTSVEAEEQLKAQKRFSRYDKGAIDRQAAAIILQQWLDNRRVVLGEMGRRGDGETGRRGDGETGRRGDGETGRRGDGKTGRRGDGETGRWGNERAIPRNRCNTVR